MANEEERNAWKQAMGFPKGDKSHLPPPPMSAAIGYQAHNAQRPTITKEDIHYYLARVEGQLARLDNLINVQQSSCAYGERDELNGTLTTAKQFLASLRNALDEHRIDVV